MATIISRKRVRKPSGTITRKKVTGELQEITGNMGGFGTAALINKSALKAVDTVFPSSDTSVSGFKIGNKKNPIVHGAFIIGGVWFSLSTKSSTLKNIAKGYVLYNVAALVKDLTGKNYLSGPRLLSGVSTSARELEQTYPESMVDLLPPMEDMSLVSV